MYTEKCTNYFTVQNREKEKLNKDLLELNIVFQFLTVIVAESVQLNYVLDSLTLPAPCIFKSCIKIKINLNLYFHTS